MDGFLVLAIPLIGVAVALFLAWSAVPSPTFLEVAEKRGDYTPSILPYATFIFPGMAGFATFPLMSFHLKAQAIVSDAAIPLFYAGAMVWSLFLWRCYSVGSSIVSVAIFFLQSPSSALQRIFSLSRPIRV